MKMKTRRIKGVNFEKNKIKVEYDSRKRRRRLCDIAKLDKICALVNPFLGFQLLRELLLFQPLLTLAQAQLPSLLFRHRVDQRCVVRRPAVAAVGVDDRVERLELLLVNPFEELLLLRELLLAVVELDLVPLLELREALLLALLELLEVRRLPVVLLEQLLLALGLAEAHEFLALHHELQPPRHALLAGRELLGPEPLVARDPRLLLALEPRRVVLAVEIARLDPLRRGHFLLRPPAGAFSHLSFVACVLSTRKRMNKILLFFSSSPFATKKFPRRAPAPAPPLKVALCTVFDPCLDDCAQSSRKSRAGCRVRHLGTGKEMVSHSSGH